MSGSTSLNKNIRRAPLVAFALIFAGAGIYVGTRISDNRNTGSLQSAVTQQPGAEFTKLQSQLQNTLLLPTDYKTVPPFSLRDVNNEELTESVLDEQWSLMFFGFTHCPDVCPVTLSVMNSVVARLASTNIPPMQVLFVSVDPVRDTAEVLKPYMAHFNEEFVGVTGEFNDVHKLTTELGIIAAFSSNGDDANDYTVDHTASMLLIDPHRRVRAKFNAPHQVDSIVTDYTTLWSQLN